MSSKLLSDEILKAIKLQSLYRICEDNNMNISINLDKVYKYSIDIYYGHHILRDYQRLFYTSTHDNLHDAVDDALLFLENNL